MNFELQEDRALLSLITIENARILDVGCGFGRFLIPLSDKGHCVFGIDKNPAIVARLRSKGYKNIYSTEEAVNYLANDFDYIVMSHIIEHIEPSNLISFMDSYLQFLKIGGQLIIVTPFLHKRFYDDYDHIKPYHPFAISLLYSDTDVQQQDRPRFCLGLKKIWLRKDPIKLIWYPGISYKVELIVGWLNKIFILLYRMSFHLLSETTGWIGVFVRKS